MPAPRGSRIDAIAKQIGLIKNQCNADISHIVDIGTDHAYVIEQLLNNNEIKKALATDIGAGPLQNAVETIEAAGLMDRTEFLQTPGLKGIDTKTDAIVIAGMGAELIVSILSEFPDYSSAADFWILQPMTKPEIVMDYIQPAQPSQSAQPAQSGQPPQSAQSAHPAQSGQPPQSAQSSQPEHPAQSAQSAHLTHSGQPARHRYLWSYFVKDQGRDYQIFVAGRSKCSISKGSSIIYKLGNGNYRLLLENREAAISYLNDQLKRVNKNITNVRNSENAGEILRKFEEKAEEILRAIEFIGTIN